ncbi:hypothetical protein G3I55_23070 [Streptomyces sp. SID6648]|nr:hypothetical protein [Streptomyces sp. SID6648]
MRCYVDGGVDDFPVKDEVGVCCPEHGVTWLWRGDPITAADVTGGPIVALDALAPGADGPCSVACRSALVTDLADVHGLCRLPGCACPCHVVATASRETG